MIFKSKREENLAGLEICSTDTQNTSMEMFMRGSGWSISVRQRGRREGCSSLINTFLSTDVNAGDRIIAVGVCGKSSERRRRRAQINRGCASRCEKTERFPPPSLSIPYLGDLAKARFHYAHRIFMRTTFLDGRARGEESRGENRDSYTRASLPTMSTRFSPCRDEFEDKKGGRQEEGRAGW